MSEFFKNIAYFEEKLAKEDEKYLIIYDILKSNLPTYSTAVQPGDLFRFYKIHFKSIPPLSIESIPEDLTPLATSFEGQLDTKIVEIIIADNILGKIASEMVEKQLSPVSFFKLITDEDRRIRT